MHVNIVDWLLVLKPQIKLHFNSSVGMMIKTLEFAINGNQIE